MKTVRTVHELRSVLDEHRRAGRRIGFVPTMGALHEGHLSLIEKAAEENPIAVVSIFVNPAQFGPADDFDAYPRNEQRDLELAEEAGATHLFAPDAAEMYPDGFATEVAVQGITEVLCGSLTARGTDHFKGVTTVVCKLLNIVQPHYVYFGRKDAQQIAVVRRMVDDLSIPVQIRALPTVRDSDGLAMSSRNRYLTTQERRRAPAIYRSLEIACDAVVSGGSIESALVAAAEELRREGIEPEYLEARDPDTLHPVTNATETPIMFAVAARVGGTRLIDNAVVETQRIPQEASKR